MTSAEGLLTAMAAAREKAIRSRRPDGWRWEIGTAAMTALYIRLYPERDSDELPPGPYTLLGWPATNTDQDGPRAWRLLDRDGQIIKEGAL